MFGGGKGANQVVAAARTGGAVSFSKRMELIVLEQMRVNG